MSQSIAFIPWSNCFPSAVVVRSPYDISKAQSPIEISRSVSGEKRLTELGIALPPPPEPFEIYVEAVKTGSPLLLTGMF